MKLFTGHLAGFALMFVFVFVIISGAVMIFPLLMAFIAWDTSFINFDWESMFPFIRINALISFIMGLSFTLSKDGKAFAKGEYK